MEDGVPGRGPSIGEDVVLAAACSHEATEGRGAEVERS